MKRRGAAGTLLLPAGDLVLVVLAFLLGWWLRHFALAGPLDSLLGMPGEFRLDMLQYVISGTVMGVIEVVMLLAFGVYHREYGLAQIEELAWILRSTFMAVVITFAFTFATRQLLFSRFVLLFAFPSAALSVAVWHWLFHRISRTWALRKGRGIRVAVYGTGSGSSAAELASFMENRASVPYRIAGFPSPPEGLDSAGKAASVLTWMHANDVSELVLADPDIPREDVSALVYMCEHEGFSYKLAADVFDLVSMTARVVHMGGTTMVESVPPPLGGGRSVLKRVLDLSIAVPAVILLLPLGLAVSAAIVLDTGFPVFYGQTRLGRGNRPFRMMKFRSMKVGAHEMRYQLQTANEATGPLFKMRRDPRVTRVGGFLRKWSIDELPQLFNVIAGSMSLVGPRPPLREEVEDYTERHLKRLQTIPGITGVWQVSGRSNLGFGEMIKLDLYYVDNWSIWMDVAILLLTLPAVLVRKGAY